MHPDSSSHQNDHKYSDLVLALLIGLCGAVSVVVPGATWTDASGNIIQGHGAGILQVGGEYYWFGEDKADNSYLFSAVTSYMSTDLLDWERQNDALTPIEGTTVLISTSILVERPKDAKPSITRNYELRTRKTPFIALATKNDQHVMWFHSDNSSYGVAMMGVATAETPCGPYTYKSSWKPLSGVPRLVLGDVWSINLEAGTYSIADGTTYQAETGVLDGGTKIPTTYNYSRDRERWDTALNDLQGNGGDQWVSLYYANGGSTWRNTTVSVNGGPLIVAQQPNTGGGDVMLSVPVKLKLK